MESTVIKSLPNDTWNQIAYRMYGDTDQVSLILEANPDIVLEEPLRGGLTIYVPILPDSTLDQDLPPWKMLDEVEAAVSDNGLGNIPITIVPPSQLYFSTGTPRVTDRGTVLEFGISQSKSYPYSIENEDGTIVFSSPLYPFTAGFPIKSPPIFEAGLYRVRVGSIESARFSIIGTEPITFVTPPVIAPFGDGQLLRYSINKTATINTVLTNRDTNEVVYNYPYPYTKGQLFDIPHDLPVGSYRLNLNFGGLIHDVVVTGEDLVEAPDWLIKLGYRYDVNTHETTFYPQFTETVEINVTPVSANNPTGITQDGTPFDIFTWNRGLYDYLLEPYSGRYSFNPVQLGSGGLNPNTQYKIRIRRIANPTEVYIYYFTTPNVSTPPGQVIDLDLGEGEDAETCAIRPTITNIVSVSDTQIQFDFSGSGVRSMKVEILLGTDIVSSAIIQLYDGNGNAIFTPASRVIHNYLHLDDGDYTLRIQGNNCVSTPHTSPFVIDEAELPPVTVTNLGTNRVVVGSKTMVFNGSPKLTVTLNADGSITDTTFGLVQGNPSTIDDRNRFYMFGFSHFVTDGVYTKLENVQLPEGQYSLVVFDCNKSLFPDQAAFVLGIKNQWSASGINQSTARLSQVNFTISPNTGAKLPQWIISKSRALNYVDYAKNKPWGKKIFLSSSYNYGDAPEKYHAKSSAFELQFRADMPVQPKSGRVFKWAWDGLPIFTNEALYGSIRSWISQYNLSAETILMDEYVENVQGTDDTVYSRVYHAYQGALDLLRERSGNPSLDVKETRLYGSYGLDDFGQVIIQDIVNSSRARVAEYLGDKLFNGWDAGNQSFNASTPVYYASGQIDVRNVNAKWYMATSTRFISSELLLTRERVKRGTQTFQGQNRERKIIIIGADISENLNPNPVEFGKTGDLIQYPNGEIFSNYAIGAVPQDYFNLGFWGALLMDDIYIWGTEIYGKNPSKLSVYEGFLGRIFWTPTGGSREQWSPGVNGSPQRGVDGLVEKMSADCIDICYWGYECVRDLDGYTDTLYYVGYSSSRKTFVPYGGTAGLRISGGGISNMGCMDYKDAYDQKCGNAVVGTGSLGRVAVYCNEHLSVQEYEDDVTIAYAGATVNFGRVYGRQTVTKIF